MHGRHWYADLRTLVVDKSIHLTCSEPSCWSWWVLRRALNPRTSAWVQVSALSGVNELANNVIRFPMSWRQCVRTVSPRSGGVTCTHTDTHQMARRFGTTEGRLFTFILGAFCFLARFLNLRTACCGMILLKQHA